MDIQPNKINCSQINKIKTVFLQYFAAYLDDCTARLEFEFGLQLGKERDKLTNEQYKKLTDYLRIAQQDIRQQYLLKIATAFDDLQEPAKNKIITQVQWNSANLLDDDFVKEDYAVSQIIRNCEHIFLEELSQFNLQLAMLLGKQVLAFGQNPASPENLLRTLFDVFKPLKLKTAYRVALYKVFDANVFSQLGFIYRELLLHCGPDTRTSISIKPPENDSIEVDFDSIRVKSKSDNNGCEALRQKLQQWRTAHSPSAYDVLPDTGIPVYEHLELINALHVLSHTSLKNVFPINDIPLKHPLLNKLEALNFSGEARQLRQEDQDILDIVALVFVQIVQDETLAHAAKVAILPLQMPMAAVALAHPDMLVEADSPVRQLLDKLTDAGRLVNEDTQSGQAIIQQISAVVSRIITDSGFEKSDWVTVNAAFSAYLKAQQHGARRCEVHYRQLMQQSEQPLTDNSEVSVIIANSLQNKALPMVISDFIEEVWLQVLLAVYPQKNELPELWQKYVQTLDDLAFSVLPPANEEARQRILHLLPGLIKALRHGFKQIAYDKPTRDRFFKELAVLHVLALDKKAISPDVALDNNSDADLTIPDVDIENRLAPVKQLPEGSWLAFATDAGKYWGKLAWRSQGLERLLFVDKSGEKLLECGLAELAEQLHNGQASLVTLNKQTITERSIENLTS